MFEGNVKKHYRGGEEGEEEGTQLRFGVGWSKQGHGIPYGIYDFLWSRSENPDHI